MSEPSPSSYEALSKDIASRGGIKRLRHGAAAEALLGTKIPPCKDTDLFWTWDKIPAHAALDPYDHAIIWFDHGTMADGCYLGRKGKPERRGKLDLQDGGFILLLEDNGALWNMLNGTLHAPPP